MPETSQTSMISTHLRRFQVNNTPPALPIDLCINYMLSDANTCREKKHGVGWIFTYSTSESSKNHKRIEAFEQIRGESITTAAMKGCLQRRALSSKDKLLLREMGRWREEPTLSSYYL